MHDQTNITDHTISQEEAAILDRFATRASKASEANSDAESNSVYLAFMIF